MHGATAAAPLSTPAGTGRLRPPPRLARLRRSLAGFLAKNRGLPFRRLFWSVLLRLLLLRLRGAPAPAHGPALLLVATHHKAMTTYFHAVLRLLALGLGRRFALVHRGPPPPGTGLLLATQGRIDRAALRPFRGIHVLRDPRDMIVSGWHYHRWTDELWVHREDAEGRTYQEKLLAADRRTGLHMEIDHFLFMYRDLLLAWEMDDPDMLELRYEDLVGPGREALYARIFDHLGLRGPAARLGRDLMRLFEAESRTGARAGAGGQGRHLRSGRAGQWRDMLEPEHLARIEAALGPALRRFGYS